MNIPTQPGQRPAAGTGYQSLYAAPSAKSTFAQTLAQSQSSWLSLTTAEGDLVTLSDLSLSYQHTEGAGWFSPISSGVNLSSTSTSAEAMGLSVQGDLNAQELADITRLVTELTSVASAFFSGDYEGAMTKAMDFGDLSMGSVSSLSASFSSQTVSQTRITSHSPLPAMADLKDLNLEDFHQNPGTDKTGEPDYATLLEARWQQILKALDEMKAVELDGLFARRTEPQPMAAPQALPAGAEEPQPLASAPPPVSREAEPAEERAAHQMLARMEQLFSDHPKFTPFAKALATTAMEKAASRNDHAQPDTARAFAVLQNAFRNQLHQWFLPPELPPPAGPPLTAV
ncbi:MAG: hypothetical protein V1782_07620 [Pseudomonadota bacterium]